MDNLTILICHISVYFKKLIKINEFCVAILILEMTKINYIFGILWFNISRKVKTTKIEKKRCVQYTEKVLRLIECIKNYLWSFMLDDAPRSGRPTEVDSKTFKCWLFHYQHYAKYEIANILKISKSSIENHVHQLGYVNCFDVCVPYKLSKKSWLYFCMQFSV